MAVAARRDARLARATVDLGRGPRTFEAVPRADLADVSAKAFPTLGRTADRRRPPRARTG